MHRPQRCRARKLSDCSGDPNPSCRPNAITILREFVRALALSSIASSAFAETSSTTNRAGVYRCRMIYFHLD
jgi:hypothetical protein